MDPKIIVTNNLQFYDKIKPKNPNNSYTVLAALNDYQTGELLVLATGTQACNKLFEDDIEDCHAESLLKRGFKRHILDNFESLKFSKSGESISTSDDKNSQIKGTPVLELSILISQFPCGLIKRYEGEEIRDEITHQIIKRKPGRGKFVEGKGMIYVEKDSCLDKLKRWVVNGMQGSRFAKELDELRFSIKQILVGQCEPDESLDYERNITLFKEHLTNNFDYLKQSLPSVKLVSLRREEFIFSPEKKPQLVSMVWWNQSSRKVINVESRKEGLYNGCLELIVDGRRRGLTKSQCAQPNENVKLKISSSILKKDLHNLLNRKKTGEINQ